MEYLSGVEFPVSDVLDPDGQGVARLLNDWIEIVCRGANKPPRPRRTDATVGANTPGRAVHSCAFMTSLLSTVPVSPWTLAPRDKRQLPSIVTAALNR